jgi:TolA-binding protein
MLGPVAVLLLIYASDDTDLRNKALEFQYEQKIAAVNQELQFLRIENSKLKAKHEECDPIVAPLPKSHNRAESSERKIYRDALREIQEEKWDDAILSMEGFVRMFPQSELADHALYWIAQIYLQKNEVGLARAELERLIKTYPHGERAKRAQARLLSLPNPNAEDRSIEK